MKSYQFFKIYKRFYKEREKTVIQQSIRKEKLRKFFYLTSYFMKPLEMAINHFSSISLFVHNFFLFCKLLHSAIFVF